VTYFNEAPINTNTRKQVHEEVSVVTYFNEEAPVNTNAHKQVQEEEKQPSSSLSPVTYFNEVVPSKIAEKQAIHRAKETPPSPVTYFNDEPKAVQHSGASSPPVSAGVVYFNEEVESMRKQVQREPPPSSAIFYQNEESLQKKPTPQESKSLPSNPHVFYSNEGMTQSNATTKKTNSNNDKKFAVPYDNEEAASLDHSYDNIENQPAAPLPTVLYSEASPPLKRGLRDSAVGISHPRSERISAALKKFTTTSSETLITTTEDEEGTIETIEALEMTAMLTTTSTSTTETTTETTTTTSMQQRKKKRKPIFHTVSFQRELEAKAKICSAEHERKRTWHLERRWRRRVMPNLKLYGIGNESALTKSSTRAVRDKSFKEIQAIVSSRFLFDDLGLTNSTLMRIVKELPDGVDDENKYALMLDVIQCHQRLRIPKPSVTGINSLYNRTERLNTEKMQDFIYKLGNAATWAPMRLAAYDSIFKQILIIAIF